MLAFIDILEGSSSLFAFSPHLTDWELFVHGCYLLSILCLLSACFILGFEMSTENLS